MRQYRIWNNIQSCLYKNNGGKTVNKSYGVNDHSTKIMNVGRSSKNSHKFAEITQTCRELENGDLSFRLYVDGEIIKEGIVSGGGVALLNAAQKLKGSDEGESIFIKAIKAPYQTILNNAGLENVAEPTKKGWGTNVVTGKSVSMIKSGIIDPVLVTKTALKNAVSVATTILSTDCVINNMRE